jgi:peptide chain release factor 1
MIKISGENPLESFKYESGVHFWQRVPPTEKRDRVHTSAITIAVLPEMSGFSKIHINERDLEWKTTRSGGNGGQSVNTTDSAAIVTHLPTGLKVRCEAERSQLSNKETALKILKMKLQEIQDSKLASDYNSDRKNKISMTNSKVRTVRLKDDIVSDHTSGKKSSAKEYLKGNLEWIYKK